MNVIALDHVYLTVSDYPGSEAFYDGVMSVLDYERHSQGESFAGYGPPGESEFGTNSLWILKPFILGFREFISKSKAASTKILNIGCG